MAIDRVVPCHAPSAGALKNAMKTTSTGLLLAGAMLPLQTPSPNTAFWGGAGGSVILIDYDARTTLAYTPNKMGWSTIGDGRAYRIIEAMWAALK